jgi:predicted AAA+ superfamily ATPase
LSGELATKLAGRYVEFRIFPLSFSEYFENASSFSISPDDAFNSYIKYGGLPGIPDFITLSTLF